MPCRALSLPLVSLLLLAILAPTADSATVTVCDAGCDFNSIQTAHDTVNPGDTLDILGTITEQGISLTKDINLTSSLPAPPIVQAATAPFIATDRVFVVQAGTQVSIANLIIRHGKSPDNGGGIANFGQLLLDRVRVDHNRANQGGGIYTQGVGATLQVTQSTIQYNTADFRGGGIYSDEGTIVVDRSTLAKNNSFEGGGIMNVGSSDLTVNNSTISMNRGINGGAGIFNDDGGSASVNSCTMSLNSLRAIQNNGATSPFELQNSLLGNSLTSNYLPGAPDCEVFLGGVITDLGHNVVEHPGSCIFDSGTSITGVDPGLSALGDFGGPTATHLLLATSPALNNGDAGSLTVDQRNRSRPQGGTDDIGAFEFVDGAELIRPQTFCAPVVAAGMIHYVDFTEFESRTQGFEVHIQDGGIFNLFEPDVLNHGTYLGVVDGVPGAIAGATYFGYTGEHYYHVIYEAGEQWYNEGGTTTIRTGTVSPNWAHLVPDQGGAGDNLWGAEVGVDLPNDRYVTNHSSDADDAVAMIEHSIMATNLVYMRQAGIQHRLGRVILRGDAAQDPYAPLSSHNEYLTEVVNQWDNVLPPANHDLALVVRAESGAGLAYVGRVGNPAGYSSNDATARGDFSIVWRHEGGHNWFLSHFDGGTPEGPTINSGNALGRMSGPEQALMTHFRDSRLAFLNDIGPLALPVPPQAATDRALISNQLTSEVIDVLANDHDANGDTPALVSIAFNSELSLGGTMELSPGDGAGAVRYTLPVLGSPTSAIDRFRYRIRDDTGLESEGFVFVRVVDFDADGEYQQDFNGFANGTTDLDDGSYIANVRQGSAARVLDQALELTEDALWRQSSFTLPPQNLQDGHTTTFRYRITSAASPADGFAFNYGAPNATRIPVDGIGDFPSGLTVEWTTWGPRGYHVRVHGTDVPGGFIPNTGLVDGLWHDVTVTWGPAMGLSLTIDANQIFSDIATPGFTPTATDMLAFSAYTGGLSEQVLIDDISVIPASTTSVASNGSTRRQYALHGNVPNPFNPSTLLSFELPRSGRVELTVYDVQGRRVRQLISGEDFAAGRHEVAWRGENDRGQAVASGAYLYRLQAGDFSATRRMILIR